MKNLAISILSSVLISGMDFWKYEDACDRLLISLVICSTIFALIVSVEDWLRDRRMKRFRSERFWRRVNENRP